METGISTFAELTPDPVTGQDRQPGGATMMSRIGAERGWLPMTRRDFDAQRTLRGAFVVGNPQEVVEKIPFQHEILGHRRFLLPLSVGTMPHAKVLHAIERLGTKVAPAVREALSRHARVVA